MCVSYDDYDGLVLIVLHVFFALASLSKFGCLEVAQVSVKSIKSNADHGGVMTSYDELQAVHQLMDIAKVSLSCQSSEKALKINKIAKKFKVSQSVTVCHRSQLSQLSQFHVVHLSVQLQLE